MANRQNPFEAFKLPVPTSLPLEIDTPQEAEALSTPAAIALEVSELTQRLQKLQERIPVASDRALIELVNGIQISTEAVRYRKSRGYFGQLIDELSGSDRKRDLLIQGNLVEGQTALQQWVLELSTTLNISQIGLEITQRSLAATQQSLLEARHAIRIQQQNLDELTHLIQTLSYTVGHLELRIAAYEDFDSIVTAWMGGRTYTNLPWAIQVVLLAREVFSSSVSVQELRSGNSQYQQRLIDKLNAELRHREVPSQFEGLADLLNQTWENLQDPADQLLCTSLLETRSLPLQQLINLPYLFTIGNAFELALLPAPARPESPGHCALELCRMQVAEASEITTPKAFIHAIVEETAHHCSSVLNLSNRINPSS
jgi:YjcZ-like protein